MSRVRPIGAHVLIRVLPHPEKSAGGLWLPDSRNGRENMGEVLAVGTRVSRAKGEAAGTFRVEYVPVLHVGEVVRFDPYKIRLVIDEATGYDVTGSVHAKAGQQAIVHEDAIWWVAEGGGA
jgi:co-chaperonin GroES (HSP10)